ncbi:prion-like-(Q/N-rich) domain-bearing protein 25 isoform X1 [Euwallacea similis]|uniref:prion-like-(Q/N-rich) domain-bearing protein 25 isoform X1 n=1 Tax=Euwallacea similis TaxID=1736056 RepID=UPI00344B1CC2
MIRLAVSTIVVLSCFYHYVCCQESEADIEARLGKITEALVSYQRCLVDTDCRDNSFCYDNDNNRVGLCKCQMGFELLQRNRTFYSCLTLAKYKEPCQIDEQCVDNLGSLAKCDTTCRCQKGTFFFQQDGRCHTAVLLKEFCKTDANCLLEDGTRAYCTDGQCQCNLGQRPSIDRKRCVVAKNLGEPCTDDHQCSFIENGLCREVCRCSLAYVISSNGTNCLKAATYFNEQCEENAQCSEHLRDSLCSDGNCTCQEGYHGFENKCVRDAGVGMSCSATEECLPNDNYRGMAECVEGVCQCLPGVSDPEGRLACSSVKLYINVFLHFFIILPLINLLM